MTIYVTWHKDIDAAFRAFYPTVVFDEATGKGETIQDEPAALDADKHPIDFIAAPDVPVVYYTVGTTRLTTQGIEALVAEFGDDVTFGEG